MKTLIIGKGQVGQAIHEVVKNAHETFIRDVEDLEVEDVEILQICYPEHDGFESTTKEYIRKYNPKLTIINSSVKIGTTEKCGERVVYSPVRGRHPKLAKDLLIYPKFVFAKNHEDRDLARDYFEECGLDVCSYDNPRSGELLKLLSNVHMGVEIAWRQEVERLLKKFHVEEFDYDQWEKTYRNGYMRSDDLDLLRPIMRPDPIGGHCILPCTDILLSQSPSKILEFVKESNNKKLGEVNVNCVTRG